MLRCGNFGFCPDSDVDPAVQRGPDLTLANSVCSLESLGQRMPFGRLKRREFITLVGGAATWSVGARAQQATKLATIGFLGSASASSWSQWTAAFVQRLHELDWIEGRTVGIEFRWADGHSERFAEIASEFVRLKADIIVTSGTAAPAAKQATSAIPIVFAVAVDPLGTGLVESLARPGGNVTGLSLQQAETAGKRLELLRENAEKQILADEEDHVAAGLALLVGPGSSRK
jgi:hypothetical protein